MKILIELPFLAPSVNSCYYTDRNTLTRHKSKAYRDFLTRASQYTLEQEKSLTDPLEVEINFIVPDKRRRDIDNMIKPVLDMLTNFKIIQDDSLIQKLQVEKSYKKGCAETIIQINLLNNL